MILITKSNSPPNILTTKGEFQTKENCDKFDRKSGDYIGGKLTFQFDNKIYGDKSVKQGLLCAQHEKCCYCEGKFNAQSYGDVEHFRPKGATRQDKTSDKQYPGYYWLAYSWNNLYVSCRKCNLSKGTLFPLESPASRARTHHDDIAKEKPLVIDPGGLEDPRSHIEFIGPRANALSETGRVTIETADLNRPELVDDRQGVIERLELLTRVIESVSQISNIIPAEFKGTLDYASELLNNAIKPTAKYSSMAANAVPQSLLERFPYRTG